jgi:hypothetical protein
MFRRTTTIAAAIATTATLAIAAGPASAIYRDYEAPEDDGPVIERTVNQDDTSGKKSCSLTLSTGQTIVYDHGYSFSVVNKSTGKTHTFTCNDGKWEETVNFTGSGFDHEWEVDGTYTQDATLVLVNPHEEHTYSSSGGTYTAAP